MKTVLEPAPKKKTRPPDRNTLQLQPDWVQTVSSKARRLGRLLSAWGLPSLPLEWFETPLAFCTGRTSQRGGMAFHYFSWKKLLNFMFIELQLRMGLTRVRGYPYEWEIDTTNICQLKCPLCHTGLGNINRLKGVMHFDTFRKTIDEIRDYVVWLSLYSWGEPLLNKQLPKFISYAHQAKVATIISSNLSLKLTPEKVEALVKSGLDVMIISLDGVTQEVYEQYRVAGKLDLVLQNIRLIVQKKKELGYKTPYLEWQFIVMKQNEHQLRQARGLARELGVDQVVFKRVDFPHGMGDQEMIDKWVPVNDPRFQKESPMAKPYNENGPRCWRLWRSAVVNWDGGYAPCCYLTDDADDFGDVNTHSIKEIWNNDLYLSARALFKDGAVPKQRVGCLQCDVYLDYMAARNRTPVIPLHLDGHRPKRSIPTSPLRRPRVLPRVDK